VAFAIPETNRAARDHFRDRLLALGAAPVHNGLYVSPHRWETEVHDEIRRFDIEEFVTVASTDDLTLGGVSDPREIAAKLWPLDEVAAKYQRFIDSYQAIPDRLEALHRSGQKISEAEFLPGALRIAIRFNQCFEIDPLLPPELLTRPWPGREAREILARCRKLGGLAREEKTGPALFRVFDEVIATLP
jgi:phenylacetic acid degradation operon negative regulatory protein